MTDNVSSTLNIDGHFCVSDELEHSSAHTHQYLPNSDAEVAAQSA